MIRYLLAVLVGITVGLAACLVGADLFMLGLIHAYGKLPPTPLQRCAAAYSRLDPQMGQLIRDVAAEQEFDASPPAGFPSPIVRYICWQLYESGELKD